MASKSSKRGKRQKLNDVDRLSALPDDIITHILSFLQLSEAIRTCILSKRWRFSWTLVSKLEFIGADLIPSQIVNNRKKSAKWFEKLVDGVLRSRDSYVAKKAIKVFKMDCSFWSSKYPDVRSWITPWRIHVWTIAAIVRNVEELDLRIAGSEPQALCKDLYTCERLRVLKLGQPFILNVPDTISLKSLKTLHLDDVEFFDDNSLNKLLSACEVEDLLLKRSEYHRCQWISCIRSSSLKYLSIVDLLIGLKVDSSVVVDAPQLKRFSLSIEGGPSKRFTLERSPFLAEAHIGFVNNFTSDLNVDVFLRLLESISNVEILKLTHLKHNALDNHHYEQLPVFCNVKRLEIRLGNNSWKHVPYLLQQVPNLETFVLEFTMGGNEWHEPDNVVECLCLASHLKKVTIIDFRGWDIEMQVVQYLLKNAMVLKTMTIYSEVWTWRSAKDVTTPKEKMLQKLLTFPRGSSTCQIQFLDS